MQRNKPLRKVSAKRAAELRVYSKARKRHLEQYPYCERCGTMFNTDLHHRAQRHGKKLNDTTQFMTLCRGCHDFCHQNPRIAREKGWLI